MAIAPAIFGAPDCELMANFANGFQTEALDPVQRTALQDLHARLKRVATTVAERLTDDWRQFEPGQSFWQFSGAVARDMWCCVYPKEAPHKSFGLQIALIIRPDGGELCFCLGAGVTQTGVAAKRQAYQQALDLVQARLRTVPTALLEGVAGECRPSGGCDVRGAYHRDPMTSRTWAPGSRSLVRPEVSERASRAI
jgi:hypothetical protein